MSELISTNPARDYEVNGEVTISSPEEIAQKVEQANQARQTWKELGTAKRIELLRPICEDFAQRQDDIAELITREMGKPIRNGRGEASGYVSEFNWFMDHVTDAIADTITHEDSGSIHRLTYEPIGTTAVITPWNFPFGMAIWGIVPNLLIGNTVVFKISEECPLMGRLIEEVMLSHDLPTGIFSAVHGAGDVGQLLAKSDIDHIWFTGSSRVGKLLYKLAGEKFIPAILEMGGSNPCLVFEDADIAQAVETIYDGRFYNCGQVCDATKRLIVHEAIVDDLVDRLRATVESKKVGDPLDESSDIGSLVAKRQLDLLESQVADALTKGARLVTGGKRPNSLKGAYYEPTILTDITKDMRIWHEEVFGPVLPVVPFSTEDEAVDLANDTVYGLGSKVISKDENRALRVASRIQAGTVEVNHASRWLCCNPFGGYKNSGMGREHGTVGFRQLCQIKVISMNK